MNIDNRQDISPIDFNRALDFCIWTLEVDGLHVPPFDRHQGGNGTLRSRGLEAGSWQAWLSTVAHAVERRYAYQLEVQRHHTAVEVHYEPAFYAHVQRVAGNWSASPQEFEAAVVGALEELAQEQG